LIERVIQGGFVNEPRRVYNGENIVLVANSQVPILGCLTPPGKLVVEKTTTALKIANKHKLTYAVTQPDSRT
jgi:hypothetical protein